MDWRMMLDSLRRRKRMLLCSFWFLLLFAAGGLVLFSHLQDLSEMVPQEAPVSPVAPPCATSATFHITFHIHRFTAVASREEQD
ncbi:unnamed protein product [Boreogadus saida]